MTLASLVRCLLIALVALLLAACGPEPDPVPPVVPSPRPTQTAVALPPSATVPLAGTPTSAPTAAPATQPAQAAPASPTMPEPTAQPSPTVEPAPTITAAPGSGGVGADPTREMRMLPTVTPLPTAPPIRTDTPRSTDTARPAPPTNTPRPPAPTAAPTQAPTQPPAQPSGDWQATAPGIGEVAVLVSDPKSPSVVYAGGTGGLARSDDGGRTWKPISRLMSVDQVAVAPSDTKVIYAGTRLGCASGLGGELYRSADSGATWSEVAGGPSDIDVNPTNPNHLVALNCDGVYRSRDGAATWAKLPGSGVQNLDGMMLIRGVDDRTVIYAVYVAEGGGAVIQRTLDDGRTWQVLETADFYAPADLALDPYDARHVYFVGATGFYASANAGQTFNRLVGGLEPGGQGLFGLGNLAIDLVSPPPRAARYSLYLPHFVFESHSSVMRWNGNNAWERFAPTADSRPDARQLLMVNDPKAPALLAAAGDRIYRLGIGR